MHKQTHRIFVLSAWLLTFLIRVMLTHSSTTYAATRTSLQRANDSPRLFTLGRWQMSFTNAQIDGKPNGDTQEFLTFLDGGICKLDNNSGTNENYKQLFKITSCTYKVEKNPVSHDILSIVINQDDYANDLSYQSLKEYFFQNTLEGTLSNSGTLVEGNFKKEGRVRLGSPVGVITAHWTGKVVVPSVSLDSQSQEVTDAFCLDPDNCDLSDQLNFASNNDQTSNELNLASNSDQTSDEPPIG